MTPGAPLAHRQAWLILLTLACGFILSQAFRTVAAIMGPPLAAELALTPQQLGLWAAAFHVSFGVMQIFMGVSLDLWGIRRTILATFPVAIGGALLSALADSYRILLLGQLLIGIGCAPAFLVCTLFISRHFAAERYTATSGLVLSLGGFGLLATATPLAWLIDLGSWRWGFGVLTAGAALTWATMFAVVREPAGADADGARPLSALAALRELLHLFTLPHTLGLVAYAGVAYAGFLTLRGLWLGPLLVDRYGFTLIQAGNVALAMTLGGMISPALFGRLDPGGDRRITWMLVFAAAAALQIGIIGLVPVAAVSVTLAITYSLISGYGILQYGYVRDAYPESIRGRALALLTMAMFLGVALMQWASGVVASAAIRFGAEPYAAALLAVAILLMLGEAIFWRLPHTRIEP